LLARFTICSSTPKYLNFFITTIWTWASPFKYYNPCNDKTDCREKQADYPPENIYFCMDQVEDIASVKTDKEKKDPK
jgi:hypothetical protein